MSVIAIDGPAASGKGTIAKALAEHYGYAYLDTGSLYRAVALSLLTDNCDISDTTAAEQAAKNLNAQVLGSPALRESHIGKAASRVAAMPTVRAALLEYQREFARRQPGAVLDGRDIATVVCPDADVKLFITASIEERSRRRFLELGKMGGNVTLAKVHFDLADRDKYDAERETAPMLKAEDAHLLDTTKLDIKAAFDLAINIIERHLDERP
jgi:cytidylate kinase